MGYFLYQHRGQLLFSLLLLLLLLFLLLGKRAFAYHLKVSLLQIVLAAVHIRSRKLIIPG